MPKIRIMVVEDDDDARRMYAIMLRSWGYEIAEAASGAEGIRLARERRPDLILLDIMMPDIDGYEVCKQLRADSHFRTVPILFLSALDGPDDRIKGFTTGGDDFINKGKVEYPELGARIKAALDRVERTRLEMRRRLPGTSLGLLSLRGGVGVSTLALNLAHHAAIWVDTPTILLDMAFPVGSTSLWSGVEGARHLAELLSRNASEINLPLIQSFSLQNVHGFRFIPGPSGVTDLSGIRTESVQRLLHVLNEEGYLVILDLGRGALPIMWQIQSHCQWLGVVTSGEMTSRSLANVALKTLPKNEITQRTLLLIFNDVTDAKASSSNFGLERTPDVFIPYTPNFQNLPEPSPLAQLLSIIMHQEET